MKLTEKQKIIVTAVVFLAITGGIGAFAYMKVQARSELSARLDQLGSEENLAREKIKRIPVLQEQRSKLINIIDQYAQILPREEHVQLESFVEIIDGYRQDTKVVIQKAEYVEPKANDKGGGQDNFVRHRYNFKLLGTVPDFIEFVNKLENHTRFLKVDAINIRPVGSPANSADDLSDKVDEKELARASEPVKEIELTVSTYTYSKGQEQKT